MKYSVKLSDAIHILSYIVINEDKNLSSTSIAESINTNPALVRKMMSNLKKSGIICSSIGRANPSLAKPPSEISFYDIYQSVEDNPDLFHVDSNTAKDCVVGNNIQNTLSKKYDELQEIIDNEMKNFTLSDVIEDIIISEKQKKMSQ